jgi:hypothetical protein
MLHRWSWSLVRPTSNTQRPTSRMKPNKARTPNEQKVSMLTTRHQTPTLVSTMMKSLRYLITFILLLSRSIVLCHTGDNHYDLIDEISSLLLRGVNQQSTNAVSRRDRSQQRQRGLKMMKMKMRDWSNFEEAVSHEFRPRMMRGRNTQNPYGVYGEVRGNGAGGEGTDEEPSRRGMMMMKKMRWRSYDYQDNE